MISSLNVVFYTCIFLLPGVIIEEIVGDLFPLKRSNAAKQTIMWLGYSVLNDAIWSWLFWLVTIRLNQGTLKFWIALVIVMFASSLLTGFIIGLIRSNDLIRKRASKLKINLEHPIPTGWEYKFFKQKEACWVIITLKTGICFRGYYGCNSLASSEQSYNDIFLELVYKEGKDGAWELIERTAGVWISPDEISSIEFLHEQGGKDNDKK